VVGMACRSSVRGVATSGWTGLSNNGIERTARATLIPMRRAAAHAKHVRRSWGDVVRRALCLCAAVLLLVVGCSRQPMPATRVAQAPGAPSTRSGASTSSILGKWSAPLTNDTRENGFPSKLDGTLEFTSDGRAGLTWSVSGQRVFARGMYWRFASGRTLVVLSMAPNGAPASEDLTLTIAPGSLRGPDGVPWVRLNK
jgi:hypothetical protein